MPTHYALTDEQLSFFHENGFVGPFDLIPPDQQDTLFPSLLQQQSAHPILNFNNEGGRLRRMATKLSTKINELYATTQSALGNRGPLGLPRLWYKGASFFIKDVDSLGKSPEITDRMNSILGQDLIWWSSQIINRKGTSHRWHADVEHVRWQGATAWLGLSNVGPGNTMKVIPGSHRYPFSPQELAASHGADLGDDESILAALATAGISATITAIDMTPGQFFIFDGPAWHASHDITAKQRSTVIFQYCQPSQRVQIPRTYDLPDARFYRAQPWVKLVSGKDTGGVNHIHRPRG
jgi:ectoine hydroxylase-related dioxygenase (phytanoyl-CoA dioxygenase family)